MNEKDYLSRLESALSGKLSDEELRDALDYYREYFAEGGEEAASRLEPPEIVAQKLLAEHEEAGAPPAPTRKRFPGWAVGLIVAAVLLAVAVIVVLVGRSRFEWKKGDVIAPGTVSSQSPGGSGHGKLEIDVPFVDISVDLPGNLPSVSVGIPTDGASPAPMGEPVTEDLASYDNIEVKVPCADVSIEHGDGNFVQTTMQEGLELRREVREGTLYITCKQSKDQINVQKGLVSITIPQDKELRSIDIETSMGDIALTGITARTMDLHTDMGNVTLDGCTGLTEVDCSSDMGDVTLEGSYPCTLELESDMGNISAAITGAEADYGMELSADMGTLSVNGQKVSGTYRTAKSLYSLTAEADMGNVTVSFTE